ncbi:Mitochodrial transcription termination factor [Vigna unguiculata]|uniref:Mitochodrial transcription termination factor n=1 Tax=Vigna unguiculata TaxID=3917 RepID=A0A4D6LJ36_VIGUN|nr:Mitochodrial transcription termination factor [Vigna unguiculata]
MSGFQGYELCSFISKNPSILTHSLKKTLVPSVEAIRKIVYDQKDFILVLHRCGWILPKYKRIMENVVFLESCGILGTHLSFLLKLHPRLFGAQRSTIENNVSRAVELGFRENSRMLGHAIHTLSCLSDKTFERKLKLINCFGFSKDEGLLIRQIPQILFTNVEKILRPKIQLFQMSGFQGSECGWILPKYKRIMENVVFLESCGILGTHLSLLLKLHPRLFVAQRSTIENNVSRKIVYDQKDFILVLHRCGWILPKYKRIMENVVFLESCGILGTHLSLLLKLHPRLFVAQRSTIENNVSRAVDLGFRENSRMLDEGLQMFKRTPTLFRTSEKKLKVGMNFFLHTVMLPKSVLIHQPKILM